MVTPETAKRTRKLIKIYTIPLIKIYKLLENINMLHSSSE